MSELPSVALTRRFLALCQDYGAERLAIGVVAVGRSTGVESLPESNDWTTWDARQMRAAVEYLERKRSTRPAPQPIRWSPRAGSRWLKRSS
ncbi:MAG: hypothetical protein F4X11_01000 [Acidobacteria bacterium]|nr:hypothetical protein [Acidobacteriota bacterium]